MNKLTTGYMIVLRRFWGIMFFWLIAFMPILYFGIEKEIEIGRNASNLLEGKESLIFFISIVLGAVSYWQYKYLTSNKKLQERYLLVNNNPGKYFKSTKGDDDNQKFIKEIKELPQQEKKVFFVSYLFLTPTIIGLVINFIIEFFGLCLAISSHLVEAVFPYALLAIFLSILIYPWQKQITMKTANINNNTNS